VCYPPDIISPGAGEKIMPVPTIIVIDIGRTVEKASISAAVIAGITATINADLGDKDPPGIGYIVTAFIDILVNINTGTKRCPSVITVTASPAYPCRSPYSIRNPEPFVKTI
jgi:hypothetical protein